MAQGKSLARPQSVMKLGIDNTGSAEDVYHGYAFTALRALKLVAVLRGSASPSVSWEVRFGPDRGAAGTVCASGTATSTTTGHSVTSFAVADIPIDSHVWVETTAQSGTVTELAIALHVLGVA